MSSNFSNIFSIEEISFLNQLPEVIKAKEKLNENLNMVYFNIHVSETIKNTLQNFNKINDKSIIMKYFYPFEVKSGVNKYKRNLEKIDKIKEIL